MAVTLSLLRKICFNRKICHEVLGRKTNELKIKYPKLENSMDKKKWKHEVNYAYRKLKHYYYYDTTNLLIRQAIADFENNEKFNKKLDELGEEIYAYIQNPKLPSQYFNKLFARIHYWVLPKAFRDNEKQNFFSNITFEEEIVVEKINYFIDAPIEVHIVSVLWIMREGFVLEQDMAYSPYGYKLYSKKNGKGIINGLKLFKPYFREYQAWRDKALKQAKELLNNGTNAAIIGLDIKRYYDSVKLDFSELKECISNKLDKNDFPFTNLLEKIHLNYFKCRGLSEPKTCLPIGLLSSGVLGNWCLRTLDDKIKTHLNPIYYGRYVDDVLIVLANPKNSDKNGEQFKEVLFKEHFKDILEKIPVKGEIQYSIKNTEFCIQQSKLSLMYFDAKEPTILLDKYREELRKNSSEFRFLPEEDPFEDDFGNAAYAINYSGSKLKIRSIKEFSNDRFGASKFLAKKIYAAIQADNALDIKTRKQLNTYFKKKRMFELMGLWERTLTYFVLTKDKLGIEQFIKNFIFAFKHLNISNVTNAERINLNRTVQEYLNIAISMALSIDNSFEKKIITLIYKLLVFTSQNETITFYKKIDKKTEAIRQSNLMRHSYISYPLLNYTNGAAEGKINLSNRNLYFKASILDVKEKFIQFSPKFVHYHEAALFILIKKINEFTDGRQIEKSEIIYKQLDGYLEEAFELFYKINYARSSDIDIESDKYKNLKKEYFPVSDSPQQAEEYDDLKVTTILTDNGRQSKKINVALANIKVNWANMKQSYLKNPIISTGRRDTINTLFNQVAKESYNQNIDMIVFPEACIPYKWINWISDHARKQDLLTIFGLEHWVVNNIAYNFNVTLLPIRVSAYGTEQSRKQFKALIPIIRLKNHYSPREVKELKGYRFNIPIPSPSRYDLINWKGVNFTVFNCFELTNLSHRSYFRSKVDFLVACEFNRDTNYFSNIVESVTRDVHCYFIQSNSSDYGDNRITKPSPTADKDILKIKGGANSTVLVGTIDIKRLRDFQLKGHELQLDDKYFKPTPPGFSWEEVEKRMKLNLKK